MAKKFEFAILLRAIDKVTAPVRAITKNFEALKRSTEASKKFFEFGGNVRNASEAVRRFAEGTASLIRTPIQSAEEFQQAMNGVSSKLDGVRDEADRLAQTKALAEFAKQLGADSLKFNISETAKGMELLAQAGLKSNQIMAALPSIMQLAGADNIDLALAAKVATDAMYGFGLQATDMTRISDVLAAGANKTKTGVIELGEAMKYAGPVARGLGLSLEETVAMVGLLSNSGIESSQAGTALRAMMLRLTNPTSQAKAELQELNLQLLDSKQNLKPLPQLMEEMARKTAKFGSGKRLKFFDVLFGMEAASSAAVVAQNAMEGNITDLIGQLKGLKDYAAGLERINAAGAKGANTQLQGSLEKLGITLGETVLPDLEELRNRGQKWAEWVTVLATRHPKWTRAAMYTMGAVALLAAGLGGLLVTISTVSSALGVLTIAMGWTRTGAQLLGGGLTFLRASLVGAIAGLRRLAIEMLYAAVWMYARGVPAAARFTWSMVRLGATVAVNAIPALIMFVAWLARTSVVMAVQAVTATAGFAQRLALLALTLTTSVASAMGRFLISLLYAAVWIYARSIPATFALIASLVRMAATMATITIPTILRFGLVLLLSAVPAMFGFIAAIVPMAVGLVGSLVPAFTAAAGAAISFGIALLTTPVGWIAAAILLLIGAIVLLALNWKKVESFIVDSKIGKFVMALLGPIGLLIMAAAYLTRNWEPVKAWFGQLFEKLKTAFQKFADWVSSIWDTIKSALLKGFNWVADKLSPVTSKLGWLLDKTKELAKLIVGVPEMPALPETPAPWQTGVPWAMEPTEVAPPEGADGAGLPLPPGMPGAELPVMPRGAGGAPMVAPSTVSGEITLKVLTERGTTAKVEEIRNSPGLRIRVDTGRQVAN